MDRKRSKMKREKRCVDKGKDVRSKTESNFGKGQLMLRRSREMTREVRITRIEHVKIDGK